MSDIFAELFRRGHRDIVIYDFVPPLSNYTDVLPELRHVRSPVRRIMSGLAAAVALSIPMQHEEPVRHAFYQRTRQHRVSPSSLKHPAKHKRKAKSLKRDKAARKARKITRSRSKTRKIVCRTELLPNGFTMRIIDHVVSYYVAEERRRRHPRF